MEEILKHIQTFAGSHKNAVAWYRLYSIANLDGLTAEQIEVGSDVWVGGGAFICPGVRIGSRSVIGAGSVVTKDIPEDVFAAGNPCKVIRRVAEQDLP